jgi:hypothetical protein
LVLTPQGLGILAQSAAQATGHRHWLVTGAAAWCARPDGAAFWARYADGAPDPAVDLIAIDAGRRPIDSAAVAAACGPGTAAAQAAGVPARLVPWPSAKRPAGWRARLRPLPHQNPEITLACCHPLDVLVFAMLRDSATDRYWQGACQVDPAQTPPDLRVDAEALRYTYGSIPDWRRCKTAPEIVWRTFLIDTNQVAERLRREQGRRPRAGRPSLQPDV